MTLDSKLHSRVPDMRSRGNFHLSGKVHRWPAYGDNGVISALNWLNESYMALYKCIRVRPSRRWLSTGFGTIVIWRYAFTEARMSSLAEPYKVRLR